MSRAEAAPARSPVIFCDFDGTITTEDMIVAVFRRFGRPGWEEQVEAMLARRKSLREGVAEVFAEIPSSEKDAIVQHVRKVARLRPGFEDLLAFCRGRGVPFVVVSGGLDFFVEPVLVPYRGRIAAVHTIPTDLSGPVIRVLHPHACHQCGICKVKIMDAYPGVFRILIGDGLTDLHGAQHADLVFARSGLARLLAEQGRPFEPFETFHDVRDALARKYRHVLAAGAPS